MVQLSAFWQHIRHSYGARLFCLFLGILLVPLYCMGWFSLRSIQASARQTALAEFRLQASSVAMAMENLLGAARQVARGVSDTVYPMGKTPWETETVLVGFRQASPLIRRLAVVEADGSEWASSDLGHHKQAWRESLLWPAISTTSEARFLLEAGPGQPPLALLVDQVPGPEAETRLLVCEIDLIGIWRMADDLRFGETGRAELYAQGRFAIACQNRSAVIAGQALAAGPLSDMLASGEIASAELERGFFASAPIPSLDMQVLLRKDAAEVFAAATRVRAAWLLLMTLTLALAMLVSVLVQKTVSGPLRALSGRARAISRGDLDIPPLPQRSDEIGLLFEDFNEMAYRLRQVRVLEQRAAVGDAVERIAHDLGTPLTALKTFVSLLGKRREDPAFFADFLAAVPAEIERLERLLEDMRDYAREIGCQPVDADVASLCGNLVRTYAPLAQKRDIAIRLVLPDGPLVFPLDPDQIQRVLVNLVNNALDMLDEGRTIVIEARRESGPAGPTGLILVVADNGPGVPEAILPRLFRPFVSCRDGGLGLGLAICRGIIQAHQGTIRHEPNTPSGARFTIWLPLPAEDR